MAEKTEIIAVVLNVSNQQAGHCITYHNAVQKAAEMNGWSYSVLLPQGFDCSDKPVSWMPCLDRPFIDHSSRRIFHRLSRFINRITGLKTKLTNSIKNKLEKMIDPEVNTIIFLESFSVIQLIAFVNSFDNIDIGENTGCWLLYRHDYSQNGSWNDAFPGYLAKRICLRMNGKLQKKFKKRFRILSDSKTLAEKLSGQFHLEVAALPIPHLPEKINNENVRKTDVFIFWWPGRPDKEKGLAIIDKICGDIRPEDNLKLKISGKADMKNLHSSHVLLQEDPLTEKEYYKNMSGSDAILLPYDPVRYADSTSGIFLESICAEKITFVTQGTWMANELREYDLAELIIDWERHDLVRHLLGLAQNKAVKAKIAGMRREYLKIHGEKAFASAMTSMMIQTD